MSGEGPERNRQRDSKPRSRVCPLFRKASWSRGGESPEPGPATPPGTASPRRSQPGPLRAPGETGEWAPGVELHPAHHLPAVHVSESPQEWGCGPQPGPGSSSGRRPGPAGAPATTGPGSSLSLPSPSFPLELEDPSGFSSPPHPATPRSWLSRAFSPRPHYLLQEVKSEPPAPDCLRVPGAGVCRASCAHPGNILEAEQAKCWGFDQFLRPATSCSGRDHVFSLPQAVLQRLCPRAQHVAACASPASPSHPAAPPRAQGPHPPGLCGR